jgi:16S rRNA processing protein RimM
VPADSDWIVVGRIGGAFGVKGWFHVQSHTSPPDSLLRYRPWFIRLGGAADWRELKNFQCRKHGDGLVAHCAQWPDRTAVQALAGSDIGVTGDVLPRLPRDEFYWRALVGCEVHNTDQLLGKVVGLMETGAHDVLVVKTVDGTATCLIPFVASYVRQVDPSARRIDVDWQLDW